MRAKITHLIVCRKAIMRGNVLHTVSPLSAIVAAIQHQRSGRRVETNWKGNCN